MKTIVIGLDGSDESLRAGRLGCELAAEQGAALVLVYVVPPLFTGVPGLAQTQEAYNQMRSAGAAILDKASATLGCPGAEQVVAEGPPAQMLVEIAGQRGAEMLVVGSHGRGAIKRILLGSTSDKVVHISDRPVLVVR